MLSNYLKVALRNIARHKGFSFINIFGLAAGMAAFILIALYIQYEFGFDKFNDNYRRIYRVEQLKDYSGEKTRCGVTDVPLGPALENDFPEIIRAVRLRPTSLMLSRENNTAFFENKGLYAENSLFKIFTFPLISGNPASVLSDPFSIVLTEKLADKYFPNENPIGRDLRIEGRYDCQVTGVVQNPPGNSHFTFDYILPFSFYEFLMKTQGLELADNWNSAIIQTYVLLHEKSSMIRVNARIRYALAKYKNQEVVDELYLKPIADIHLFSHVYGEIGANSDIIIIYLFAAIAVIVLLLACINYANLSTARFSDRAREIGIRKAIGSRRRSLVIQFLGESIVLSAIAMTAAIALVELFLPWFRNIMERDLDFNLFNNYTQLGGIVILIVMVGLLSGSYPAFFMSTLDPIKVLKRTLSRKSNSPIARTVLVVTQFIASIVLIMGTLLAFEQLDFLKNMDLGFDSNRIVVNDITNYGDADIDRYRLLKSQMLSNPNVTDVTISYCTPNNILYSLDAGPEGATDDNKVHMYLNYIDYDYLDTYGMSMAEGRGFSEKFPADAVNGCIINKKASGIFGWKSAVGKTIISDGYRYSVIGVIKDYHFQSLTSSIAPMIMVMLREQVPQQIFVSAKIVEDKAFGTINFLSNTTREFFPEDLSGFEYLNEQYRGYYDDLTRIAGITGYFSVLAILIASLGLFALVSYMTNQSLKEIGIRKVLGASFTDIIRLLTRNFVNILLVANLIAWPVGYIICHNLLQNYPYRVDIGFWVFGLSGLSALIMVMAAVSYQAIMAALANPVEAIKYE